jgi:hypothetical protein
MCERPWNYPVVLSLLPLTGAMAAGCPAMLKSSEVGPVVVALFADLLPKYLNTSAYRIINRGVPEITARVRIGGFSPPYRASVRVLIVCFWHARLLCPQQPRRMPRLPPTSAATAASTTTTTTPIMPLSVDCQQLQQRHQTSSIPPAPSTLTLYTSRLCCSPMWAMS